MASTSDDQSAVVMRRATEEDLPGMEAIRAAAFAPVFASFRSILGDVIYESAQAHEDQQQADLLASLLQPDSGWRVYVAEWQGAVAGFLTLQTNARHLFGEIGLNAVHPDVAGQGIGTEMYRQALQLLRESGMRVATVATGGDPSHAPARRAYAKAGFHVQIPSVWMCCDLESKTGVDVAEST